MVEASRCPEIYFCLGFTQRVGVALVRPTAKEIQNEILSTVLMSDA